MSNQNHILRSKQESAGAILAIIGTKGVESMAEIYATEMGITIEVFCSKYEKDAPKYILAFPSSESRGTWDSIRKAAGKILNCTGCVNLILPKLSKKIKLNCR